MIDNYLALAQNVVGGRTTMNDGNKVYHHTSFIYKTTNEEMQQYQKFLQNRKRVLTVISSSEQIFNQVIEGTKNIDVFDISIFPYFFFELKRAGCLTFSDVKQYCDFFYADINSQKDFHYDEQYDAMREQLSGDVKKFWDGLFQFYDWPDIFNSMLFSSEPYCMRQTFLRNKHLQSLEYQKLRENIGDVTITPYIGDINELCSLFTSTYDFINLSNIVSYQDVSSYLHLLKELPLDDGGDSLTYFYKINPSTKACFKSLNPQFFNFSNADSGVMIYTKKYK